MRIAVKDLRRGMKVYDADLTDSYRVFKDPEVVHGRLQCEVTTAGDYEWLFFEGDVLWTTPDRKD